MTRLQVVRMLREAGERLEHAVRLEDAGYRLLAHDELAKLFNDPNMLPRPDQDAVRQQEADRVAAEKARDTERLGSIGLLTGVGEGATRPRPNNRSWGPEAPTTAAELPLFAPGGPASDPRRSNGLDWYGAQAEWWVPFERDARRRYGDRLEIFHEYRRVTYRHAGLAVPGLLDPVPVTVEFFAEPPYATYGMRAEHYPRVWADPAGVSPHRMPDRSLCLYYPGDPPERRWGSELGLLSLLDVTRDHLFFEHHWRATGAFRHGVWLGP